MWAISKGMEASCIRVWWNQRAKTIQDLDDEEATVGGENSGQGGIIVEAGNNGLQGCDCKKLQFENVTNELGLL